MARAKVPASFYAAKVSDKKAALQDGLTIRVGIGGVCRAGPKHLQQEIGDKSLTCIANDNELAGKTYSAAIASVEAVKRIAPCGRPCGNASIKSQRLEADAVPWFAAEEQQVNDLICLWDSVLYVQGQPQLLRLG